MADSNLIRLATRGSALALWQANRVAELLRTAEPGIQVEKVIVSTKPDRIQDKPLQAMGGDKGLFVKEVEQAILDGHADAAVHSLKDVPVEDETPGLELVAFPERADAHDVLLTRSGGKLKDLPAGSMVATGAPRRRAQLLALRPDFKVCGVRGNVETRVRKLEDGEFDAIIMAAAGLKRLGLDHRINEELSLNDFVPAPGQGIVVVQAAKDSPYARLWAAIDSRTARLQAEAERDFSRRIGADCHTAAGCHLEIVGETARFRAVVCSGDGSQCLRFAESRSVSEVTELVADAADSLLKNDCAKLMRP